MGLSNASDTATALTQVRENREFRFSMTRLLDRLLPFIRVDAVSKSDELPEHDVAWVTMPDDGPEAVIARAMVETPGLWLRTLPKDVCIVPRGHQFHWLIDQWVYRDWGDLSSRY